MAETNGMDDVLVRLRRLEGQIRGLQRLVQEKRDCAEVITQYLAARAALEEVGARLVDAEIGRCLPGDEPEIERVRETLRLLLRVRR
ncbi:MAG: metal-sensitive transcriptional regulator [Anaerolineae bacterium]